MNVSNKYVYIYIKSCETSKDMLQKKVIVF